MNVSEPSSKFAAWHTHGLAVPKPCKFLELVKTVHSHLLGILFNTTSRILNVSDEEALMQSLVSLESVSR